MATAGVRVGSLQQRRRGLCPGAINRILELLPVLLLQSVGRCQTPAQGASQYMELGVTIANNWPAPLAAAPHYARCSAAADQMLGLRLAPVPSGSAGPCCLCMSVPCAHMACIAHVCVQDCTQPTVRYQSWVHSLH